eukprot:jgi/Chrzof1/3081/Cz12g11020.t1
MQISSALQNINNCTVTLLSKSYDGAKDASNKQLVQGIHDWLARPTAVRQQSRVLVVISGQAEFLDVVTDCQHKCDHIMVVKHPRSASRLWQYRRSPGVGEVSWQQLLAVVLGRDVSDELAEAYAPSRNNRVATSSTLRSTAVSCSQCTDSSSQNTSHIDNVNNNSSSNDGNSNNSNNNNNNNNSAVTVASPSSKAVPVSGVRSAARSSRVHAGLGATAASVAATKLPRAAGTDRSQTPVSRATTTAAGPAAAVATASSTLVSENVVLKRQKKSNVTRTNYAVRIAWRPTEGKHPPTPKFEVIRDWLEPMFSGATGFVSLAPALSGTWASNYSTPGDAAQVVAAYNGLVSSFQGKDHVLTVRLKPPGKQQQAAAGPYDD